ncbi:MAG: hypothetical protein KJO40_18230 [Deltaproteobacteria bacterium]|nr:hypothetical protein [Deltaproteobacteria bacterium]
MTEQQIIELERWREIHEANIRDLSGRMERIEASLHGEDHEERKRWEELDARNECPKDVPRPGEPSGLIHGVHELAMAVGNLMTDLASVKGDVQHERKRIDRHASRLAAVPECDLASRMDLDKALDRHAREMHRRLDELDGTQARNYSRLRAKLKGLSADDLAAAVRWALKYKREVEQKLSMPSRFQALVYGLTGRNGRPHV